MATIHEGSLLGSLTVSTSPSTGAASWTDHTATVSSVSLSRGGDEPHVGVIRGEVGAGTISLLNNTATIEPGYWVKVATTGGNVWTGFVSDVITETRFYRQQSFDVKVLTVLDWVALLAQYRHDNWAAEYQIDYPPPVPNGIVSRAGQVAGAANDAGALNLVYADVIRTNTTSTFIGCAPYYNDISLAEMLDLSANSHLNDYWYSAKPTPTNSLASGGVDAGIVYTDRLFSSGGVRDTGLTFTDGTHWTFPLSSNLCRYSDIRVTKQTSTLVNSLTYRNTNGEFTFDYAIEDATSVATYGRRSLILDVNAAECNFTTTPEQQENLFSYPSFENLQFEGDTTNFFYSIERPAEDSTGAWDAYDGAQAFRAYNKTGAGTAVALSYDERIPVTAGQTYYGFGYAATSATPNTRARYRVVWYNEANAIISTVYSSSYTSLSSFKTWYKTSWNGTAPANAVYARIGVSYDRSTGAAFAATSKQWADGMFFGTHNITTYFDGDTADTSSKVYYWAGTPDASVSIVENNVLDDLGTDFLTANATPTRAPKTIVWNAQDNLAAVDNLELYKAITVFLDGERWYQVITGIAHDITTNGDGTDRWLVTLTLRPSEEVLPVPTP